MRFIHSLNFSLVWRRYRNSVKLATIYMFSVLLLITLWISYSKYSTLGERIIEHGKEERNIMAIKKDVAKVDRNLRNNIYFDEFKDKSNNIPKDKVADRYQNDMLFNYLHNKPDTIIFNKIDINEETCEMQGQSKNYTDIGSFVQKLKDDMVFSKVFVMNIDYYEPESIISFKLVGIKSKLTNEVEKKMQKRIEKGGEGVGGIRKK